MLVVQVREPLYMRSFYLQIRVSTIGTLFWYISLYLQSFLGFLHASLLYTSLIFGPYLSYLTRSTSIEFFAEYHLLQFVVRYVGQLLRGSTLRANQCYLLNILTMQFSFFLVPTKPLLYNIFCHITDVKSNIAESK